MPSQNGGAAEQSDVATLKAKIEGIKAKVATYHQAIESKTSMRSQLTSTHSTPKVTSALMQYFASSGSPRSTIRMR
jgi:phage shock protein A